MRYFFTIIILMFTITANSQKQIDVSNGGKKKPSFQVTDISSQGFQVQSNISSISFDEKHTAGGTFEQLKIKGMLRSYRPGYPDLPVFSKLFEIPPGASVRYEVTEKKEKVIDLSKREFSHPIMPAQPSRPKIEPRDSFKFHFKEKVYKKDRFYKDELIKIEKVGVLRNKHLGSLQIAPLQYNPVSSQLKIITELEFEVKFVQDKGSEQEKTGSKTTNPYYSSLPFSTINQTTDKTKKISSESPITYVIVSDPKFENTLQPFVEWKRTKGFHVKEAYTDEIGSSKSEIKAYLKDLYENPDPTPPGFVLFVGDVEQIPAWSGETGGHYTDLYYCEYTGDYLPEVYYGRFSAKTVEQLKTQIDKTLIYEKYEMEDPSYLSEALLVAGDDEGHEDTYGNGQINYGTTYYFTEDNGVSAHSYLQDPPEGNSAIHDSIMTHVSNGVSVANYTAHCSSSGWASPRFSSSDISNLNNQGKYGLWIGNCCESAMFNLSESFAELALRAENKGAIGYIGGSADTYWDEDYWWAVGLTNSILSNPTYEESGPGIFDGLFHTHGEAPSEWYITQGQIPVAGNLAIESSSSSLKQYYWEVYHLMGDPSLMPYLRKPTEISVSHSPEELLIGMNSLSVSTEPHAYVALTVADTLIASGKADENGSINLNFGALDTVAGAKLVVTAQNRIPKIKEFVVRSPDQPFISLKEFSFHEDLNGQADYGDTIRLNLNLVNLSDSNQAFEVNDTLYSNDSYIEVLDSVQKVGTLKAGADTFITNALSFIVSDSVKDQHQVPFNLKTSGKNSSDSIINWNSDFSVTLNAPVLQIDSMFVDDQAEGNSNGILEPGESIDLQFRILNTGHSSVKNLYDSISVDAEEPYLEVVESHYSSDKTVAVGDADTAVFKIKADTFTPMETEVELKIYAHAGDRGQYETTATRTLTIGDRPDYKIDEHDSVLTCSANFYDAGGVENAYFNYDDDTITFYPASNNKKLKAEFSSFSVEENYDKLVAYDGASINSLKIGTYDSGNPPKIISSTDTSGALTFHFTSDQSVREPGWKATITCVDSVVFFVNNGKQPVEDASVTINGHTEKTNSEGKAIFLLEEKKYRFSVTRPGYYDVNSVVNAADSNLVGLQMKAYSYSATFEVRDAEDKKMLDAAIDLGDSTEHTENGIATLQDIHYQDTISYRITSPEYYPVEQEVVVTGDTVLSIALSPVYYKLTFNIKDKNGEIVEGAEIMTDTVVKETDNEGKAVFMLKKGLYPLHIHKEQFVGYTDTLLVNDSTQYAIDLVNFWKLDFAVKCVVTDTLISNSTISIDTFNLTTDITGSASTFIPHGVYDLKVHAGDYHEYNEQVAVSEDGEFVVNMEPERRMYFINFTVKNKDDDLIERATIEIDTFNLNTDLFGKANTGLYPGDYYYTVSAQGYENYDSSLAFNSDTSVSVVMNKRSTIVNSASTQYDLNLFPNPTSGKITVRAVREMNGRIIIRNAIGVKMFEQTINEQKNLSINLNGLEKGLYIFQINLDGFRITKKVLFQ
jgi:hypothetical protein